MRENCERPAGIFFAGNRPQANLLRRTDYNGPIQLGGVDCPDGQSRRGHNRCGFTRLLLTGLDEQVAVRGKPLAGPGGDPAVKVKSVDAPIEGSVGLVETCFRWHGSYRLCGHIGSVDGEDLHPASQPRRQCCEQVTLVHLAAHRLHVVAGTLHCQSINIGRMQFDARAPTGDGGAHCPGSAAEVDNNAG